MSENPPELRATRPAHAPERVPGLGQALGEPEVSRGERHWHVALDDGRAAILSQQLPELAHDEALRRRYVYEAERRARVEVEGLAPIIAIGPDPDPRDPAAAPPWRLRAAPRGETLDGWLARRAPAPADEAVGLAARLAEVLHRLHGAGMVARNLDPRHIVVGDDGSITVADVGLARLDILSTRTASSLLLESSPYAPPEHLWSTVLDLRADIYTVGAVLWHALVGELPFADGPALLRERTPLPALTAIRPELPTALSDLVADCLAEEPSQRPESAAAVAEALRTGAYCRRDVDSSQICQACGATLRAGMRLCLACGREAVRFSHVDGDDPRRFRVMLMRASEDAAYLGKLRRHLEALGEEPPGELAFLVGDARMYSKEERKRHVRLPATLFDDLTRETADALAKRLADDGFRVRVRRARSVATRRRRAGRWLAGGVVASVAGAGLTAASFVPLGPIVLFAGLFTTFLGAVARSQVPKQGQRPSLSRLRKRPAALPASDPLVARLAELLQGDLPGDVRSQVTELALLVQRLCDRRAILEGPDADDFARVIEPVEPLVDLAVGHVRAIAEIDRALASIDEGTLVRALATSEARGEPSPAQRELLEGLDRLRDLEDRRSGHMQAILEASSLMRRTAELGLSRHGDGDEHYLRLARAVLEEAR